MSREINFSCANGDREKYFPRSGDHEPDSQSYLGDPCSTQNTYHTGVWVKTQSRRVGRGLWPREGNKRSRRG